MATTVHRLYPLPNEEDSVYEEFVKLQQLVLPALDNDVHALFEAINGLAPLEHTHEIGEVEGLTEALAGKMPASTTFALSDLTDVVGVTEAPDSYLPVKSGSQVVFVSPSAAIPDGALSVAKVSGLGTALTAISDELATKAADDHTHALNDLTDVDTATTPPVTGQGLVFNGTLYVPGPAGGGMFVGNNGVVGNRSGDVFRVNDAALTADVTIPAGKNASATGPLSTGAFTLRVEGTLKVI